MKDSTKRFLSIGLPLWAIVFVLVVLGISLTEKIESLNSIKAETENVIFVRLPGEFYDEMQEVKDEITEMRRIMYYEAGPELELIDELAFIKDKFGNYDEVLDFINYWEDYEEDANKELILDFLISEFANYAPVYLGNQAERDTIFQFFEENGKDEDFSFELANTFCSFVLLFPKIKEKPYAKEVYERTLEISESNPGDSHKQLYGFQIKELKELL